MTTSSHQPPRRPARGPAHPRDDTHSSHEGGRDKPRAPTEASALASAVDRGHASRQQGDVDAAFRWGIAALEAAPHGVTAAALLARLLVESGRTFVAGETAVRLVDAYVRRGDLPQAVVMAHLAAQAGEDGRLLEDIAHAFGRGSKRVDGSPSLPPPLPVEAEVSIENQDASHDALLDQAEKALESFLAGQDEVPAQSGLPVLPLFGALEPEPLRRLLETFELRELRPGERVIHQGEEGRQAYVLARGLLHVTRERPGEPPRLLATLGPGAIFGEMALVSHAPRAASVEAVHPSFLLAAGREALEALAHEQPAIGEELAHFCRQRMLSNLLRHSPILAGIDASKRESLVARLQTRVFEPGDVIVQQGEPSDGAFLIASGQVQVSSTDGDGDRVVIADLGPGDVVGEISLLLRRPANADVLATHPTVTLALRREHFRDTVREHPTLLYELYDIAARRDEETQSVVAQTALDVENMVLV